MPRKRVKRGEIPTTERKRNMIFKKRVTSLTKKASDLSILCGVDIGIVVHKRSENNNNAVLWPSPQIFAERLRKFLNISSMERSKKMVIHEKYLDHRLNDENEDLLKLRNKKELKESQQLIKEVLLMGKSFNGVEFGQLKNVQDFAVEMVEKLENRVEEIDNEQHLTLLLLPPPPPSFISSGIDTPSLQS